MNFSGNFTESYNPSDDEFLASRGAITSERPYVSPEDLYDTANDAVLAGGDVHMEPASNVDTSWERLADAAVAGLDERGALPDTIGRAGSTTDNSWEMVAENAVADLDSQGALVTGLGGHTTTASPEWENVAEEEVAGLDGNGALTQNIATHGSGNWEEVAQAEAVQLVETADSGDIYGHGINYEPERPPIVDEEVHIPGDDQWHPPTPPPKSDSDPVQLPWSATSNAMPEVYEPLNADMSYAAKFNPFRPPGVEQSSLDGSNITTEVALLRETVKELTRRITDLETRLAAVEGKK